MQVLFGLSYSYSFTALCVSFLTLFIWTECINNEQWQKNYFFSRSWIIGTGLDTFDTFWQNETLINNMIIPCYCVLMPKELPLGRNSKGWISVGGAANHPHQWAFTGEVFRLGVNKYNKPDWTDNNDTFIMSKHSWVKSGVCCLLSSPTLQKHSHSQKQTSKAHLIIVVLPCQYELFLTAPFWNSVKCCSWWYILAYFR